MKRMIDRAPNTDPTSHAPHMYRTPHQLMLAVQHQREDKEAIQLSMVRVQARLRQIGQALTLHKRLVRAVAAGDVPRIAQLISVCIKHGDSVGATMDKIAAAISGNYKPKGYTEEELHISLLALRFGGPRLITALQHKGFPSARRLADASIRFKFKLCTMGFDAAAVLHNIEGSLQVSSQPKVLSWDELALETGPRYDQE